MLTRAAIEVSSPSSASRPTIGAERPGTPRPGSDPSSCRTSYARAGSVLPFIASRPASAVANPRAARTVRSDARI